MNFARARYVAIVYIFALLYKTRKYTTFEISVPHGDSRSRGILCHVLYTVTRTMSKTTNRARTLSRSVAPTRFRLSSVFLALFLLGGACALLLASGRSSVRPVRAATVLFDDLSVTGPPTLPAATVNAIFTRLGSPMSGSGAVVEQASRQTNIDDAFALAVWWTETNDGAAGVGLADRNPGSVRGSVGYPSAYDGYTIYPNYTDAINYWFHMLRNLYVDRGLSTVYAISHPYVGTSTSYLWAAKVINLMLSYRGEAPPPTPVPTIAPSPTFSPLLPHHHPAASASNWNAPPLGKQQAYTGSPATLADQSSAPQSAPFSPLETWGIVIVALLLALTIVLWAEKRLVATPAIKPIASELYGPPSSVPVLRLPTLPTRPLPIPNTNPANPFPQLPETPGKLRRTVLLPSQPESEIENKAIDEEGTVSDTRRPTGLLARYGK